ncbi:MAG: hypothetical protein I8H66_07230 [Sphingobacteriia bacterium]|nr:hypothetical protein [Sphingobacteriia bacterium]
MDLSFEKEKNLKATVLTAAITIVLFSIFFYVRYTKPVAPPPPVGEGIEVNLGNSETGSGDIAPEAPGSFAEQAEPTSRPAVQHQADPIAPATHETAEDIAVNNSPKPVRKTEATAPVVKPAPAPPKPKAIFKGGTTAGTGGNNADSYNGVRNQGIAGGGGDQGNPNGNPNSDSYTGNASSGKSGTGGVSIRSGLDGRRITRLPSFEDDFNENAKVAVDITVDKAGNVIAAIINPRGTTTTNAGIRNIALRKARTLKLNSGNTDEQTGTLIFNFKLRS